MASQAKRGSRSVSMRARASCSRILPANDLPGYCSDRAAGGTRPPPFLHDVGDQGVLLCLRHFLQRLHGRIKIVSADLAAVARLDELEDVLPLAASLVELQQRTDDQIGFRQFLFHGSLPRMNLNFPRPKGYTDSV